MSVTRLTSPWDDHLMAPAFWGFVSFATNNLMDQYEAESGKINLSRDAIGRMIDKATGHDLAEAQRFVDWCVTQFGTPEQVEADT